MKQNLYYKTMFRRHNRIKEFLFSLFLAICSVPRILLEVFVRKNFGERYFSFSTAMIAAFVLFWVPFFTMSFTVAISRSQGWIESKFLIFVLFYVTWYVGLAAFVYMCIKRRKEIKRMPGVFDFARFSLSAGTIHPKFYGISFGGKHVTIRQIETLIEPGFFFFIGFCLFVMGQFVGYLIMFCAVCYSISYFATYWQGDNFIMDKIDEMILNEEMVNNFSHAMPDPDDMRGVRFYGRVPADPAVQRQLVDNIIVDTDVVEAR